MAIIKTLSDASQQLLRSASRMAADVAMKPAREEMARARLQKEEPTIKRSGKKGAPFSRLINYCRNGPFHRQVGIKWLHGESWPIMQTYYTHEYLHATKGWRGYTGGERIALPQPAPAFDPSRLFYGYHGPHTEQRIARMANKARAMVT